MNGTRWLACVVGLGSVLLTTSGCISRLPRYDVVVRADQSLADANGYYPSIELHLIAPSPYESKTLERNSMSEYWNPNRRPDPFDRHVMLFGAQKPGLQILGHKDPIWQRWSRDGAISLFALADLPGLQQDRDSVEDPRRLIIPLRRTRLWIRPRWIVDIRIDRNGLYYTPPRNVADEPYRRPAIGDTFQPSDPSNMKLPDAHSTLQNPATRTPPWPLQK